MHSTLNHPLSSANTTGEVLWERGDHRWVWLGSDSESGEAVSANQYLIQCGGRALLCDPGSVLDFARSVANIARFHATAEIDWLFYSHQDPDVSSSAAMWSSITPARLVMSALWTRFLPHFGELDVSRLHPIADDGGSLELGGHTLQVIPAHFLHSPGNILLYDPESCFLFSGDVGANLVPPDHPLYIDDFKKALHYTEGFHTRYMACNAACRALVDRLDRLKIDAVVPQHGAIWRGKAAIEFLAWLRNLRCGADLLLGGGR